MKIISSLLIFTFILNFTALKSPAQTSFQYDAELIVKKGSNADKKAVRLTEETGEIKINGIKDKTIARTIPKSSIKLVAYSYSDKPQIKEAILSSLIFDSWLMGLPFFFNKTKRHWLVINTDTETVFFELKKENYRRLLFDLNSSGVKVEDLGDKDRKQPPPRNQPPDKTS